MDVCKMVTGNRIQCDMQMLGSLIFGLARLNMWPLPDSLVADDMSVRAFSKSLLSIEFVAYRGPRIDHSRCSSIPWCSAIEQVLSQSNPELLNSQQRHLEEQSKK